MAKLGVGVGEEFPAEAAAREEIFRPEREEPAGEPTVIHHHHHYRPRRRRLLRVALWVTLVSAVFRSLDFLANPPGDWRGRGGWADGADRWPPPQAYLPAVGSAAVVLAIGLVLWLTRQRAERSA